MRVFKSQSPFLSGFTASEREALLAATTRRRFKPAAVITSHGEPATKMFLIAKGRARYFVTTPDGRKVILMWLAQGDVFGAEALRETEVLVWDRAALQKLAERYPKVLENALLLASSYVDWNLASHIALSSQTARQRLAGVVASLVPLLGHPVPGGIELEITNEELANAAHVSVFTTSRLLNEWQRQRALTKHRGRIVLLTPRRLFNHR